MIPVLARLLIPLVCLTLALVLRGYMTELDNAQVNLLTQLPWVLCGLATVIALLLQQPRELGLSVIVLLSYWVIRTFLQDSLTTEPAGQIYGLLSFCLPLLLALVLILPDTGGWRRPSGLIAIFAAPAIMLCVALMFAINSLWFAETARTMLADPFYSLKLSTNSVVLFAAAILASAALVAIRNRNTESSILGCSLLGFATLGWFQLPYISSTLFSVCGALLVINQIGGLLNLVYRDELTQIANRRALQKTARALGQNYSLAMVDIDHFKKINDTHGHDLGDQVLKVVSSKLRQVGGGGRVFRYGGEEFCVLFKGKSAEEVTEQLEALRKAIAEYDMVLRDGKTRPQRQKQGVQRRGATRRKSNIRVTVSMGLADSSVAGGVFESVMKAADKALYGAKRGGRNRVMLA